VGEAVFMCLAVMHAEAQVSEVRPACGSLKIHVPHRNRIMHGRIKPAPKGKDQLAHLQ